MYDSVLQCVLFLLYTEPLNYIAEPFIIILQEDETTSFSYPIGAAIDLQYFQTNIIQDGSGDEVTTSYVFVPELHKPLQQPTFVLTVSVQYSWASPSLNGGYVLCSKSDTPLLCGGRITISVTSKISVA